MGLKLRGAYFPRSPSAGEVENVGSQFFSLRQHRRSPRKPILSTAYAMIALVCRYMPQVQCVLPALFASASNPLARPPGKPARL
jgi:hypothetical protein